MLKVKDLFNRGVRHKIGNGCRTSFWGDVWLGECPLKVKYNNLFNICQAPDLCVAKSLVGDVWNINFNRSFGEETSQWENLKNAIMEVDLNDEMDKMIWCLEKSRVFLVRSLYRHIAFRGVICKKK